MPAKYVLEQKITNGSVIAPAGAAQLYTPAEGALLDLMGQPAWREKPKSWFGGLYADDETGSDGFIVNVPGHVMGLDGLPQYLIRHPEDTTSAQRVPRTVGTDGRFNMGQASPATTPVAMGTLLSSANAVLPEVSTDGVNRMTVAMLAQQPASSGGFAISGDTLGDGSNIMAIGFGGAGEINAYTRRNGPTQLTASVTGANGGGLMALVVEFTGLAAANIYVNGVLQAVSGTPNCGPVAAGQRFRIGSIRTDVGNSFSTPLDGFIEEFLVFPSTGAEIRTAVRNLFLERHPGMTIAI